eukprot:TRINITY_DN990_c0_g2_i1.p1 TRINITY_DN990_c0_g2~~TRINITY_DN990_c0_g2_i1.p1  ORF type:complete len:151 (-),score=21.65 TRINITY_DN990_c0_g2_i1:316-768(-)
MEAIHDLNSPLTEAALKVLSERKAEVNSAIQDISGSSNLLESQYFRGKLKGVLEDTVAGIESASKAIKDQSSIRIYAENFFKEAETKMKELENQLLQTKRLADEYLVLPSYRKSMECNRLKSEMLKQSGAIDSLENKTKYLSVNLYFDPQ